MVVDILVENRGLILKVIKTRENSRGLFYNTFNRKYMKLRGDD